MVKDSSSCVEVLLRLFQSMLWFASQLGRQMSLNIHIKETMRIELISTEQAEATRPMRLLQPQKRDEKDAAKEVLKDRIRAKSNYRKRNGRRNSGSCPFAGIKSLH